MAKPTMTTEQEMTHLVARAQRYRSLCLIMAELMADTVKDLALTEPGVTLHPELLPALVVVFEATAAHLAETIHQVMKWAEPLHQIAEAPHGS